MTKAERAYQTKMQALIDGVGRLQDREVDRVLELLEQARAEIAARVASTEWQAHHIPQLRAAVENAVERFRQRYMTEQAAALANMFRAGIDMVDAPLAQAGFRLGLPEISLTALAIAQGYSADLIQGLSKDMIQKINGHIIMGIMGEKTPYEVMQLIGVDLKDKKGAFASVAHRAEAITRTEMAGVNGSSRQARGKAVADEFPDLPWKKKWISSGKAKPRPHHAALDGVMVDKDEDFPGGIPYPHAPGLPAAEVVNCG